MPGWAGGLYDGKIRLPVAQGVRQPEQLRGAIFHEYCHHLVHLLTGGQCPTWLNEGLAQTAEGIPLGRARQVLQAPPAPAPIPLRQLAAPFGNVTSRPLIERYYAQSLLIVAALIEDRGWPAIQALLSALGHKNPLDEALMASFETTLDGLDERTRRALE